MDEAGLVSYCKSNNAAAQKILYTRYAEDMMLLCLRYIPEQEIAREVLMDSFLSFFKNIGQFSYRGEGSVKAWLKKIVVNHCLSQLRKRSVLFVQVKEEQQELHSNDERVLDYLNTKEIMKMIHALPDGYRMVFNLYVFEGMSHQEIAVFMGISEGTSKSQLHRARVLLKEKILQTS
jgi:RNA polymerase sigma-70 factor, ECF subfamily